MAFFQFGRSKPTQNLRRDLLQRRSPGWRQYLFHLDLGGLGRPQLSAGIIRLPRPATALLVAEVAEIAIAAAQALASQTNLFPPQEAAAGAAEIWTRLHVAGGNIGLGRILGGITLVAVDERLRNT